MDSHNRVNVIKIDFYKAFEVVPHKIFLHKLSSLDVGSRI